MLYCGMMLETTNSAPRVFQLPHKPQMLQGYANKVERKRLQTFTASNPSTNADTSKLVTPRRTSTPRIQRTPQVNSICIMSLVFTLTEVHIYHAAL